MDYSSIIVIVNVIILIIAFFIKIIHDYMHRKNVLHPKLDEINTLLQQITNPDNNILLKNNNVINQVQNVLNEENKIEEKLLK